MWADNETTRDLLGFRVHADLIRRLVTNSKMLPLTVGIFGDWGSGKTSVMHMLREDLDPKNHPEGSAESKDYENVACLYFNGWLFEGYDDAKSALLSSVLLQLKEHQRIKGKLENKVVSLLKSVNWMRLARFGFKEVAIPAALAYFSGGATLIPTIIDKLKGALTTASTSASSDKTILDELITPNEETDDPTDVRTFRERFGELLEESDITSLVILIDDLDRCSPQRIIDNLEAIKLFLSVERTAFVIGADRRIVRHAIATVYRSSEIQQTADESDQSTDIVDDYLEKLIQVPYWLPRLSPSEVETYMSLLFCERYLQDEALKSVYEASEQHRQEDRYRVFGFGSIQKALKDELSPDLSTSLLFCTASAPLLTEGLKGNPRQVKRFLNAYVLRKQLADVAKLTNIQDEMLVKLMVLEYAHPSQFNTLYKWQASQEGSPQEIRQLEAALDSKEEAVTYESEAKRIDASWNKAALKRWVDMKPRIDNIDLRDYFWITRDRLQSTLSQLTLVSPVIRRIYEDLVSGNPGRYGPAVDVLAKISGDEIAEVYTLLVQHIQRSPDERTSFDGIFELVEKEVPGSLDALVDALDKSQVDRVNPSVGVRLRTISQTHAATNEKLAPMIDKLRKGNTRIAALLTGKA